MVGEMRDLDTVDACIKAAETGHLVLSTLHTHNAASTIGRMVGFFPSQVQENIRHRLAEVLVATVSLRLVRGKSGEIVVPAMEIMHATSTIKSCIRDGHLDDIEQYIEKGRDEYHMQTLDQHLIQLCRQDVISLEEAKRISRSTDLERKLIYS
jgi:twitching motility protein PilT